jgi:hypothetical protein
MTDADVKSRIPSSFANRRCGSEKTLADGAEHHLVAKAGAGSKRLRHVCG